LLISSLLVFGIFREITIGDGFLELISDFNTLFFFQVSEFFTEFEYSFASKKYFLLRHREMG
jgi:hypothetical protein